MDGAHSKLNSGAAAGQAAAAEHLDALIRAYARALRGAGRRAAARFEQTRTLVAAAPPDWLPPPTGSLIDSSELAADTERKTAQLHRAILAAAAAEAFGPLGLSFDIHSPASEALLAGFSRRIEATIGAAIAEQVTDAIQAGYAAGDSVAHVSEAIQAKTAEISKVRADMLARSDLNGIANGASVMAAELSGAAVTKVWLTAGDDLVRPDHADAEGQEVAISETFDIGGESLAYPGDPEGSWEQIANCRCTVAFSTGEAITASANGRHDPGVAVALPAFRLEMPPQLRPVAKVQVAAPDVQVHVRNEVQALDVAPLERVLAQVGPLLAAASDAQRADLVQALEALAVLGAREFPTPAVTVAAAEVAPPDLTGLGPAVAAALAPYLAEMARVAAELLAALQTPRSKRIIVNRGRGGEITNLTIEEA